MSQSIILCEGFHDRAFWKGWLLHLNCTDPGLPLLGQSKRPKVKDPWGITVVGGQFAFHSTTKAFIRVVPCHGRSELLPAIKFFLDQRNTYPIKRLVLNVDSDQTASGKSSSGLKPADVENYVRQFEPSAALNSHGDIEIDNGATIISLLRWEVADPPTPGLPDQQTLERLVCAALAAAYPHRGAHVHAWLDKRPGPPPVDVKEHAWSYMAGWYAPYGCDAFYSHLWDDPYLATELQTRLQSSGAWQVAAALAGP